MITLDLLCREPGGRLWHAAPWQSTPLNDFYQGDGHVVKVPKAMLTGASARKANAHLSIHRQVQAGGVKLPAVPAPRHVWCRPPGESAWVPALAYPMVAGQPLQEMLASGQPLGDTTVLRAVQELGQLLLELARRGMTHGALTPEHILLDGERGLSGVVGLSGIRQTADDRLGVLSLAGLVRTALQHASQFEDNPEASSALWEMCAAAYEGQYNVAGLWGLVRDLQFALESLGNPPAPRKMMLAVDLSGIQESTGAHLLLSQLLPHLADLSQERVWPAIAYCDPAIAGAVTQGLTASNWSVRNGRPPWGQILREAGDCHRAVLVGGADDFTDLLKQRTGPQVTVVAYDARGGRVRPAPGAEGPVVDGLTAFPRSLHFVSPWSQSSRG